MHRAQNCFLFASEGSEGSEGAAEAGLRPRSEAKWWRKPSARLELSNGLVPGTQEKRELRSENSHLCTG
jgi:hypothetical protein